MRRTATNDRCARAPLARRGWDARLNRGCAYEGNGQSGNEWIPPHSRGALYVQPTHFLFAARLRCCSLPLRCQFWPTLIPPQLTVKTFVGPPGDPGLFDITIDEAVVANNVGNNAVSAPQVAIGLHVVGQTGATSTDVGQYVTLIAGDCPPDGSINLNWGDVKTCTITNTRGTQALLPTDSINGLAVGKSDGIGSVSNNGAAVYQVPLWVPPGRAGIQPELSLVYNSGGGNGPEGVGWALTGFFEITRCRRTLLQDGEAREVTFTDGEQGDRYCLNG